MNEQLQDIYLYQLTFREVLLHLLVALVCGIMISVVYRQTYKGLSYSTTFVNSLIMLTMITSVVIMVIGNNLATAFGLVGAMSIIRFRTAVKDTQDIMFIFFALAIGLASGVGIYEVALLGTIIVGVVFYIIVKVNMSAPRKRDFLLQMVVSAKTNDGFDASLVIGKFCRKYSLVNVKALGEENNQYLELSYYIKLKKEENSQVLVKELKLMDNVQHVNLFFDEE